MFDFRPVYSYAVLQGMFRILRFFLQSHSTSYTQIRQGGVTKWVSFVKYAVRAQ